MPSTSNKGKARAKSKENSQGEVAPQDVRTRQEGSNVFKVDDHISHVSQLYRQLTGGDPRQGEAPFAPIPPEVDAEAYVQENLGRLMERLQSFGAPAQVTATQGAPASHSPVPQVAMVNVWENDNEWMCEFDLPGIDKKDVHLSIENGQLHLRAVRNQDAMQGWRPVLSEMIPCQFERFVPLPVFLDGNSAKARHENGQLFVQFQKSAQSVQRNMQVKIG